MSRPSSMSWPGSVACPSKRCSTARCGPAWRRGAAPGPTPGPSAGAASGLEPGWRLAAGGGDGGRRDRPQAGTAEVKLPDVNLLLHAVDESSGRHEPARAWGEERLSGAERWGLA